MEYKVHILMGLPGSGKSYFANTFNKNRVNIINLDDNHGSWSTSRIQSMFKGYSYYKDFVLDGLLLTTEDIAEVMSAFKRAIGDKTAKIIIHYWNENREDCLKNDSYRVNTKKDRKIISEITIKNAKFDSLQIIRDYVIKTFSRVQFEFDFVIHEVYKMDKIDEVINKYSSQDYEGKNVIESESWCNGGTWCNCWGNEGTVETEKAPEFEIFDNLLTELCPNITFLQYKKLYNACVWIDDYNENDYYGGSTSHSVYKCNVKKLKEMLIEMNLIKEN